MSMKICARCGETKPTSSFNKFPRNKSGLQSYCRDCYREYGRAQRYGVDESFLDGMYEAQGGQCLGCGTSLKGGYHVDHCHDSGNIRGLLCQNCNMALGQTRDDPETLRALADYVETHNV